MRIINDQELGDIRVKLVPQARLVRFKLSPTGELVVTAPTLTPLFIIKQAIRSSKSQLKEMLDSHDQALRYSHNQLIGKSHKLVIVESSLISEPSVVTKDRHILVTLPPDSNVGSKPVQRLIQAEVIKIMRKEARAYLSRRLKHLAQRHGFSYASIRYTHTGTRWGSCSSQGTISLNIALMKLPLELIDYVLIHELCHTKQMNHSAAFWSLVESCLPNYKILRRQLKTETPSL